MNRRSFSLKEYHNIFFFSIAWMIHKIRRHSIIVLVLMAHNIDLSKYQDQSS